jgi:MFS family permease
MRETLRNRSLLIIGISEAVSNTGSWISMMAVFGLIIFRGQGSVAQSSLIYLAGLLPTLLFSPLAGWLCDHFDRKLLMIASELLSGLAVSGIIFTQSIELIYVLLVLQAICASVMGPARQSSVPDIVDRDHLVQANAFLQQMASVIKIFAPILAGALLAVMPPRQAVILDVISYGLSALILAFLPALQPKHQDKKSAQQSLSQNFLSGLRDVFRNSQLGLLFSVAFIAVLGIVGIDILATVATRDVLKGGENLFGLEVGLIGLGTLVGAAVLMLRKQKINPWQDILIGLVLMAVLPASMAAIYTFDNLFIARLLASAACFVGGFGIGRKMVQAGTLLQTLPPPHLVGQTSGLFQSVTTAAQIIGTLITPLIVPGLISIFTYFSLISGIILLAAGVGFLSLGKTLFVLPVEPLSVRE